jgi:hypothetical protein
MHRRPVVSVGACFLAGKTAEEQAVKIDCADMSAQMGKYTKRLRVVCN